MATIRRTTLRTGAALAVAPAAVATAAVATTLEGQLHEWVIGQESAVAAVAGAMRRWREGLNEPGRPLGSFMFLGPNGVGKTHLAKAAAALAFGTPQALTRVHVPSVVDPAALVGTLRARPQQVVLFDEVEKASSAALGWLRQILAEGRLGDGAGRAADLQGAFVVLTSLKATARLDEMARLTERVTFRPLTPAELGEVARRMKLRT